MNNNPDTITLARRGIMANTIRGMPKGIHTVDLAYSPNGIHTRGMTKSCEYHTRIRFIPLIS